MSAPTNLLRYGVAILFAVAILALATALAWAHSERQILSPQRFGAVPSINRIPTAVLHVCKVGCPFSDIQAAVNAAPDGAEIRIHRGYYKELPTRSSPDFPADNADGTYSYAFQLAHPNAQSLIGIIGRHNLTLAGWDERTNTYADPRDVVIDGEFNKHVGIRADRADGVIVRNLSFYGAREHGIYAVDLDGFTFYKTVGGWVGEYPLFSFASDHILFDQTEAFGTGDAAFYCGGMAQLTNFAVRGADNYFCAGPGNPFTCCTGPAAGTCYHSAEIAYSKGRHSTLGYSGTQGNWVFIHDSEFVDNSIGIVTDSETDHPNYPENSLRVERNRIHDNNLNIFDEDSDVTQEVFYEEIYLPVGTGLFVASGNANQVHNNQIWGNSTVGAWLASGQGTILGPTGTPPAAPFQSSCNRMTLNKMFPPAGVSGANNALDFSWDGLGNNNCWENNSGPNAMPPTMDFTPVLCSTVIDPITGCPVALTVGNPVQGGLSQGGLVYVPDPMGGDPKPLCYFTGTQPCFKDPSQTEGNEEGRNTVAGCLAADDPLSNMTATGGGRVVGAGGSITFSFDANRTSAATTGSYKVKGTGVNIVGTVNGLHRDARIGTIDGPCTLNGATAICTIVFNDKASPGAGADTVTISATPMVGSPFGPGEKVIISGDVSMNPPTTEPCDAT